VVTQESHKLSTWVQFPPPQPSSFQSSSAAERVAVNHQVVGSIPNFGALVQIRAPSENCLRDDLRTPLVTSYSTNSPPAAINTNMYNKDQHSIADVYTKILRESVNTESEDQDNDEDQIDTEYLDDIKDRATQFVQMIQKLHAKGKLDYETYSDLFYKHVVEGRDLATDIYHELPETVEYLTKLENMLYDGYDDDEIDQQLIDTLSVIEHDPGYMQ
jgi:hypothetical protein